MFIFSQGFQPKSKTNIRESTPSVKSEKTKSVTKKLSLQQQKILHKQRRISIINEFGKSVINFLQDHEIWTPLHIIDFLEVDFSDQCDFQNILLDSLDKSREIHLNNLKERYYKRSLNLQPSYVLLVLKKQNGEIITSFKNQPDNIKMLLQSFKIDQHRLLLVRYFVPPIPDDLYKFDDVILPKKFQEVVKDIVNYVDINYSLDNLDFEKCDQIIENLCDLDIKLNLKKNDQDLSLKEMLTTDYSHVGYDKLTVKQIIPDTVEKNPITIPLFVLLLAFFCSDPAATNVFTYHYLFSASGTVKEGFMNRGEVSFPKLFNGLLDESLLPEQFNKCLSIIYNESFRLKEPEINDLFLMFRDKYNSKHEK